MNPSHVDKGNRRIVIDQLLPAVAGGNYPIKRVVGEALHVKAVILCDSHEFLQGRLLFRQAGGEIWHTLPLTGDNNDQWEASITLERLGLWEFTVEAWIDRLGGWIDAATKKAKAKKLRPLDFRIGAAILQELRQGLPLPQQDAIEKQAHELMGIAEAYEESKFANWLEDRALQSLRADQVDRSSHVRFESIRIVRAERKRAQFSSWYEFFPRSTAAPGGHGTFRTSLPIIDYAANMGFDVIYLPPIHPIGVTNRKGKNNAVVAEPDDVGSPWAIGAATGGHKAIHSALGDIESFLELRFAAESRGMELAMDLAYQCSPDHPYVKEHPEWFVTRPDGSIQYAENPPKEYQDIYPLNFECEGWQSLWDELLSVMQFWVKHGIKIFRVDNPHTKSFRFWEWAINRVQATNPEVIFLAEAFTRPHRMEYLAKVGFTQSYTYFTWRQQKWEIERYFRQLTSEPLVDFFRPNLWPNTPDILPENLQEESKSAYATRFLLAATLGANYGVYGPAFEQMVHQSVRPGSEEYLDSEKYQLRSWNLQKAGTLVDLITHVNRLRREHKPLQQDRTLVFHRIDNDQMIAFTKQAEDELILCVINLDPHHTQSGFIDFPIHNFNIEDGKTYQLHDLLTNSRFFWQGSRNYLELNPAVMPAHIFRLLRQQKREEDFDYFW